MREYYLPHHGPELHQFYRLTEQGVYEPLPVALDGTVCSEVLPGLRWRLDEDRQPPLDRLVTDPVYQDSVWLEYQQQQIRLEQVRARAERLAARLRAAGVDPDVEE